VSDPDSAPRQLVVGVDLLLRTDAAELSVRTAAGQLVVDADSFRALRALYALRGDVRSTAGNWLPELDAIADETPVVFNSPAEIRVRGWPVARYTPGKPPSRFSRLLSIGPFQPDIAGLVRAARSSLRETLGW